MAMDGFTIGYLVKELNAILINAKVDKIHQPNKVELSMTFRSNQFKNKTLTISADSSLPFLAITTEKSSNPTHPPMFTMLMRKHILGARVDRIWQPGLERVIVIDFTTRNELGDEAKLSLITEIMGKHSNIILVDTQTYKVLDSIKRVPEFLSRVRPILPGLTYRFLDSHKLSILDLEKSSSYELIKDKLNSAVENSKGSEIDLRKIIYGNYEGISPGLAAYALNSQGIEALIPIDSLRSLDLQNHIALSITNSMDMLKSKFMSSAPEPTIFRNNSDKTVIEFSVFQNFLTDAVIAESVDSINTCVEYFFIRRNKDMHLKVKAQNTRRVVAQRIDLLKNKISKLRDELLETDVADDYKFLGDLILSNIYNIEKGMDAALVPNYFSPNYETVEIKLDTRLTPNENSQVYYKKYNKLKSAIGKINVQLQESEEELNYLENILISIDNSEDYENIEEIAQELFESNLIKKRVVGKKKKIVKTAFMNYKTSSGLDVLAGKNNLQNDRLTLKEASNSDVWLHTKDIPGSHVVIRTSGKEPSHEDIIEGAKIAAWNSKGRLSSQVPVDYTLVKFVKKPSGAKPGMVIYTNNKTVYVSPDEDEIEKLKS